MTRPKKVAKTIKDYVEKPTNDASNEESKGDEAVVLKNVSALPREALDALVTKAIHEARTITADEVASLLFTTRKRGIGELPSEILVSIFNYLPIRDRILITFRVCQHFRKLVDQGVFDEVRFLKTPVNKNIYDPFAWVKKHTFSAFIHAIPKNTVRTLMLNHHFITPSGFASMANKELQSLVSLTLVGSTFLSKFNCLTRANFPNLRVFRLLDYQNHNKGPDGTLKEEVVNFLRRHKKLEEINVEFNMMPEPAGNLIFVRDPKKSEFYTSLRKFRTESSISLHQLIPILESFPNLVELEVGAVWRSTFSSKEERVPTQSSLNGDGFATVRIPFIPEDTLAELAAKRQAGQAASLRKLIISRGCTAYYETDSTLRAVSQACPELEVLELKSEKLHQAYLMCDFPKLKKLVLQQPVININHDWDQVSSTRTASFHGFRAPSLETVTVYGKLWSLGSWNKEKLKAVLPEGATLLVTGEVMPERSVDSKNWIAWL